MQELRACLGDRLSQGVSILDVHSRDEGYSTPQKPQAVAFPETTEEVSQIVKICARHACPIIAYGTGTPLEGQVIPVIGGISLDMSRMNGVISIHVKDLDAVVQPGVTRTQLNEALRATRASGTNTIRYGTIRENIMALEVVLPDGEIIRTGSRARKSASGYDLTHLFIGSEGTLGIITELTVRSHGCSFSCGIDHFFIFPDADAPNCHYIELSGELAGILALGEPETTKPPRIARAGSVTMVAGVGFEPTTFRL